MNLKFLRFLVPVFLCSLFIASCDKDKTIPVGNHLKAMIPYKRGQLVTFKGSNNHTFTGRVEIIDGIEDCQSCGSAGKPRYIQYNLMDTTKYSFNKIAELSTGARVNDLIFLTIYRPFNGFRTGIGANFKTKGSTAEFLTGENIYSFHDTITLGGKTYKNVLQINSIGVPFYDSDFVRAYYSKEKGIIRYEYQSGLYYQLVEL